jgi:hypothetical protein
METYILKLTGENLSQYVIGKISGIIDAMTGIPDELYPNRQYSNGHCEIYFDATDDQYKNIMTAIDKRYKGVVEYVIVY